MAITNGREHVKHTVILNNERISKCLNNYLIPSILIIVENIIKLELVSLLNVVIFNSCNNFK